MSAIAARRLAANPPASVTRALGAAALVLAVGASAVIAAGAAGNRYLLELPGHVAHGWIAGPLSGAGVSLGPGSLSAALLALAAAYLVALAVADSIPPAAALGAVSVACLLFALAPTIVSSDVFGYIAYAREVAHGSNPYLTPPVGLRHDAILQYVYWKHQTSPYGPLFTIVTAPLGLLSASVALWSFKALAGLSAAALALTVAILARTRGASASRAAIFVGLNPVLLLYAVGGAHNDVLAACLVIAALALVYRGREAAGAGAAVAAAAVKVTLGLALPFVLVASRRRPAAVRSAALAALAIAVPSVVLFGPHLFGQLARIVSRRQFDIAFSGPDMLARALGAPIDGLVRAICTASAAAVALAMVAWAWRGGDPVRAAGWAFLALVASIASLAPWYLAWVLPLAAVGRGRALNAASLLASGYLLAVHLPLLGGQPWLSPA